MTYKTFLLCAASIATIVIAPAAASTARDTVDLSLPTQLPRNAIPRHYAVSITPDADKLIFTGQVSIDLDVTQATRSLTLNAVDIAVARATLAAPDASPFAGAVALNENDQSVTIDFGRVINPGRYRLAIDYSGKINRQANGLFALDYNNVEGKPARALFTQFEAPDARRFMPSWDEPDYRATFDLTAVVPAGQLAVSNMPISSSRALGNGLKEVRFATTPEMSSYLLFFGVGDLERISKPVGDREVGVVASRGNVEKARYALDAEAQILPYYNDYFGTPYPLPKLDNVAGPGQSQFFAAMENWGAIFTFERGLLLDSSSSESSRQYVFGTEAHEIAHQWFGDLVTMAWWDDLWLNEGFATWMANKTVQHFHPDWGADVQAVGAREAAMDADSFAATHPIVQRIRTVEQTNQAFDTITYQKGESVISMLEGFAGADKWRQGIRAYVAKHAYQNSRTEDLWAAMESAGASGLTKIARDFTTQPGVPLITVESQRCVGGRTVVNVSQSQFSIDDPAGVAAKSLSWHVPVRVSAGEAPSDPVLTENGRATITAAGCGPLLINPGQTGYFRTLYRPDQRVALAQGFGSLQPVDQYGVMDEQLSLAEAGYQPMGAALDILAKVGADADPGVIGAALSNWGALYRTLNRNKPAQRQLRDRAIRTFEPRLKQLGLTPSAGESARDSILRQRLIVTLGTFDDPLVLSEAKRLSIALRTNPSALSGPLKQSWLQIISSNASASDWDTLHQLAQRAPAMVDRIDYYQALGNAQSKALAEKTLALAMSAEPGPQISPGIMQAVARQDPGLALDYALARLDQLKSLIDLSASSQFIARLAANSDDPSLITKLNDYAKANVADSDRRPLDQAIERIRWRSSTNPRIARETAAWLAKHKR